MNEQHSVEKKLAQHWPAEQWLAAGVLLAVSGGADSVALLRAMAALGEGDRMGTVPVAFTPSPNAALGTVPYRSRPKLLAAAHFNHGLRGAAADADERFVVELCRTLAIPCHVGRAGHSAPSSIAHHPSPIAHHPSSIHGGESLETAARTARYAFLQRTAEEQAIGYVATAHTADDQVETILHRLLRGTGLTGLSGMRRARPLGPAVTLLRPLLTFSRRELVAYLDALGQPYCRDEMNADPRFMRSRIRHGLLPLLRENYNPGVDAALLRLGGLSGEAQAFIRRHVDRLREQAVACRAGSAAIDCRRLADVEPYLVRELLVGVWTERGWPLQAMGFDEWERLRAMVQAPSPAERQATLPGGIAARRDDSTLTLAPRST